MSWYCLIDTFSRLDTTIHSYYKVAETLVAHKRVGVFQLYVNFELNERRIVDVRTHRRHIEFMLQLLFIYK